MEPKKQYEMLAPKPELKDYWVLACEDCGWVGEPRTAQAILCPTCGAERLRVHDLARPCTLCAPAVEPALREQEAERWDRVERHVCEDDPGVLHHRVEFAETFQCLKCMLVVCPACKETHDVRCFAA